MRTHVRNFLATSGAAVGVAVAAQVSVPIPGSPVPQSLQTLAVVLVGMAAGPGRGALGVVVYVLIGALGLPVFADGAGGMAHVVGPTAGYLVGFILAAALAGWWVRQPWGMGFLSILAGVVVAHGLILAMGWMRLVPMMGAATAFSVGVGPFLIGGVVKSAVGAALARAWLGQAAAPDGHGSGADA